MENSLGWLAIGFVLIVVFGIGMDIGWYLCKRQAKRNIAAGPPKPKISANAVAKHIFEELEPKIWKCILTTQPPDNLIVVNREEKVLFVKSENLSGWTAIGPFWVRCTESPTMQTEMPGVVPNIETLVKIKAIFEYWLIQNNIPFNELTEENMTY